MTPEEADRLLEISIHKLSIAETLKQFEASSEGLTAAKAKDKRNVSGLNTIPPPLSAPAWLCCLLPCLLHTESMEKFHECVPEHAFVKRNGKWIKLDSSSIVLGDLIKVESGERVPADLRLLEVKGLCSFDTWAVSGHHQILKSDINQSTPDFIGSPNMALCGYLCKSGECIGIVVAVGENNVISKKIRKKEFPPCEKKV